MSGVFYLCNVLQFVIDRFNQSSFSEQNFIGYAHQAVLHVVLYLCDKLYVIKKQVFKQCLSDISLISA